MSINRIVGRLLLLNHIDSKEAIELLSNKVEEDNVVYETDDDYAKQLDEAEALIEPISDEEIDRVLNGQTDECDENCSCRGYTDDELEDRFKMLMNLVPHFTEPNVTNVPFVQIIHDHEIYDKCDCNPKNGGHGNCNCIGTGHDNIMNCTVENCVLCNNIKNNVNSTLNGSSFTWANQTVTCVYKNDSFVS